MSYSLISYFNRTHEELITNAWPFYRMFFLIEIWLTIINILHSSFFLRINMTIKPYHKNLTNIISFFFVQHILHCSALLLQRILIIFKNETYQKSMNSSFYIFSSMIRTSCFYISFFILAGIIVERTCATILLETYEKKTRCFISAIIIIFLIVFGILFGITFHFVGKTYFHLSFVFIINILIVLGNKILSNINKKYISNIRTPEGSYSLAQRYQISENIRVCKMVKGMVFSISFFNFLLAFSLLLDNFVFPITFKNINSIVLDINFFLSSFIIPHASIKTNPKWSRAVKIKARQLFFTISSSKVGSEKNEKVKNFFGKDLKTKQDVSEHFYNLHKIWDETSA